MSSTSSRSPIVVVDPVPNFRFLLSKALTNGNGNRTLEVEGPSELTGLLGKHIGPAVVIFGPDASHSEVKKAASNLQARFPEIAMILVSRDVSQDILFESLHSGIRDVLPISFTSTQLNQAVARAEEFSRRMSRGGSQVPPGDLSTTAPKVITVMGAKTGCGSSFVAANLAVLLASPEVPRVALVDLNLLSGDLAVMFQIRPKWTICELAAVDKLDGTALDEHLIATPTGVTLLAAPLEPGENSVVTDADVRRILGALRDRFPFVIVDVSTALPEQTFAALEESNEVVLIGTLDVPSIKNLMLSLRRVQQLDFGRGQIRLVLNRANSRVGLSTDDVEKAIGTTIDFTIPSSRDVPVSINEGSPLVWKKRKSPVAISLERLAIAVGGQIARQTARRPFRRR